MSSWIVIKSDSVCDQAQFGGERELLRKPNISGHGYYLWLCSSADTVMAMHETPIYTLNNRQHATETDSFSPRWLISK